MPEKRGGPNLANSILGKWKKPKRKVNKYETPEDVKSRNATDTSSVPYLKRLDPRLILTLVTCYSILESKRFLINRFIKK